MECKIEVKTFHSKYSFFYLEKSTYYNKGTRKHSPKIKASFYNRINIQANLLLIIMNLSNSK